MSQLRKTKTNYEFLVQVSKTRPEEHGRRLTDIDRRKRPRHRGGPSAYVP